ncbi:hypothetical protein Val02_00850 [Virgisporangium aliadipatigenens]|uniref:Uncharacterized protein n=1 Tax=Virgisporangium aliadipatigenens TaxID=741659 RepID=A0A8J3YDM8_9ACTN|nr:hypothetical protein Val02_00850 [Virgisporangium aliadipatigenens]
MLAATTLLIGSSAWWPGNRGTVPIPETAAARPPATGGMNAIEAPEVVGSDPTLFHLDVADLRGWSSVAWSSGRNGHEELVAETSEGGEVRIELSRDPQTLAQRGGVTGSAMVWGNTAETTDYGDRHMVRWQPAPGLWAQVRSGVDAADALRIAESVRLDRVFRCAVPFRLVGFEATTLVKCATHFTVLYARGSPKPTVLPIALGPWGEVWLSIGGDPQTEYQVAMTQAQVAASGMPAQRITRVPARMTPPPSPAKAGWEVPAGEATAYVWGFGAPDEAVMTALVGAIRPVDDVLDMESWPTGPFG